MTTEQKPAASTTARKKDSTWDLIKTFLVAVVLALIFRSLAYEPFHIPSSSMVPTLLEGDYIFVSKPSYGYSRYSFPLGLELFKGRLMQKEPQRGDVAVFRLPKNPKVDYIKRIIGLPGDQIQVVDGVLQINGQPLQRRPLADYQETLPDNTVRSIRQYLEILPEGQSHAMLDETKMGEADNTSVYEVPAGHYFVMGDNRDNSIDSRFSEEVGFIPAENLIGRAQIILFSLGGPGEWWQVWKWPDSLRRDRFARRIN